MLGDPIDGRDESIDPQGTGVLGRANSCIRRRKDDAGGNRHELAVNTESGME